MKLFRSLDIKCPSCGKISTLGDWSDKTYSMCINREMKRKFLSLTDSKAFSPKTDKYYMCPKCLNWCGGYSLSIVNTEDKGLLSLGGMANVRIK